jgi:predicted ATPase
LAYHLSTDILRGFIDVPADAGEDETSSALRRLLIGMPGDAFGEVYPFLGHLLGLRLEDEFVARVKYLDGPALQARYIAAYRQVLAALAREQPTVIVADDIHWADPSSVELGLQLLPLAAQLPIAIILLTRPDREAAGWRMVAAAREVPGASAIELHLSPLADEDSRMLVNNLLQVSALPENLRQLILAKAEGNPFYVEEVIRMLIDRGGLVRRDVGWSATRDIQSIEIPDTLQGVIMARIDRLPEEAKRVLQVASVIGRRFQVRVLEMVLAQQDA